RRDRRRAARSGRRTALLDLRSSEPRPTPARDRAALALGAGVLLHAERCALRDRARGRRRLARVAAEAFGRRRRAADDALLPRHRSDGDPTAAVAASRGALEVQRAPARRLLLDADLRRAGRALGMGDAQARPARLARAVVREL